MHDFGPRLRHCVFVLTGSLLLESKIQPDTAYQKQQETLIVWSEGDNFDLALSFQEKAGCDEIWEKICQVGFFTNFPSSILTSYFYRKHVDHSDINHRKGFSHVALSTTRS